MRNLDQIRAGNAFEAAQGTTYRGANDGEVVKKIPTMIRENGLLGALAFACETKIEGGRVKPKNEGHNEVFGAIITHLNSLETKLRDFDPNPEIFHQQLCSESPILLQAITAEVMAYLSFLRRFARGENDDPQDGNE